MTKYYLAVDIGASSGRLILGHLENGKMELEEVHRFENGMVKKDGELCWEFDRLFQEIKNGLKKCKEIGKIPVQVEEGAGFVVNRILIPMINEAAFIKMEGVSDIAGIDAAMKLGANHPMGPLELGDFIGLDICLAIMDVLYNETGDSKYRACPLLRKMVRGGNLGCKSGKGFYVYNADRTKTPVDAQ